MTLVISDKSWNALVPFSHEVPNHDGWQNGWKKVKHLSKWFDRNNRTSPENIVIKGIHILPKWAAPSYCSASNKHQNVCMRVILLSFTFHPDEHCFHFCDFGPSNMDFV